MNRIKKMFFIIFILMSFLLVACNQSVEFRIYFDSNGGSEVHSIKTDGTSIIAIPKNPIKEGYMFNGWYWDNNTFTRPFTISTFVNEPLQSNMTVYAKWRPIVTSIMIIGPIEITKGDSMTLSVECEPNSLMHEFNFSSANEDIAIVNSSGVVIGVEAGITQIFASLIEDEEMQASVTIVVEEDISISITNAPSSDLLVGGTITLGVSGVSSQRNISWESMNSQIATVSPQGQVLGIAPGTVIIKVTEVISQAEDSITLTVAAVILESITIKNARSLEMNKTLQLTIQATPTGASNAVDWLSSNPSVASVSASGLVTGVNIGKSIITAISKITSTISTTVEISVTTPIADGGVSVTIFGSETMSVGETQNLQFVLQPAGTTGGVKWSTSNPSVATVNQTTGALLGVSPGVANIMATYNTTDEVKPFDVITVTVSVAGASGISISIVGPTTMVVEGQSTLVANVSSGGVIWSSSNEEVASINSNGIVTALSAGSVIITATSTQDTNVKKNHTISVSGNTVLP